MSELFVCFIYEIEMKLLKLPFLKSCTLRKIDLQYSDNISQYLNTMNIQKKWTYSLNVDSSKQKSSKKLVLKSSSSLTVGLVRTFSAGLPVGEK